MGTLSFSVGKYAKTRGAGGASIRGSEVVTSGVFTTSGTAANIEDVGGDISVPSGAILFCFADEAMRVSFNGAATTSTGHYIPAGIPIEIECSEPGTVSAIDVA
jgi:hypothetical protein